MGVVLMSLYKVGNRVRERIDTGGVDSRRLTVFPHNPHSTPSPRQHLSQNENAYMRQQNDVRIIQVTGGGNTRLYTEDWGRSVCRSGFDLADFYS